MPPAATVCSSGMPTLSGPKSMISFCKYTTSSSDNSPRCAMSSGNRFRICRYTIESAPPVPNRTWAVFKESESRFRSSLTSSDQNGFPVSAKKSEDDGGCDNDKWMSALEVKPTSSLDGSGNPPPVLPGDPDLLKIPGVGPKNLTKLVENDIVGVDELKKIYKDKFSRKSNQKMVEFLRSSVGIKNKSHAQSITTFVKKSVIAEKKAAGAGANSDAIPATKRKVKEDRKPTC